MKSICPIAICQYILQFPTAFMIYMIETIDYLVGSIVG